MRLSDDLVQRIETALEPIDGETAYHLMLGHDGRIAMSTLQQYKTAQETLAAIIQRGDNGAPATHSRAISSLKRCIAEELKSLENRLRELAKRNDKFEGFDPTALAALADELKQEINPNFRKRTSETNNVGRGRR